MPQRPPRWLRAIYRGPLVLYRAGAAGWETWLGMHWMLIVTCGRKSGREHAVLVDLLGAEKDRYFAQAAYGRRADWVRNIAANPHFEAQVGRDRFPARLEQVAPAAARGVMRSYVRAHRFYSPFIAWMLGYRGDRRSTDSVADWLVETFGMLAIVRRLEISQLSRAEQVAAEARMADPLVADHVDEGGFAGA